MLLKIWPALWTFAGHRGIEPTNNHAERALRGAVIYRKLSFAAGPKTASAASRGCSQPTTTCRLQWGSPHEYLIDMLGAQTRGDPVPLLA